MKNYKKFILICASFWSIGLAAQSIQGKVFSLTEEGKKQPLPYANVFWQGTTIGTNTNKKGEFNIEQTSNSQSLIISVIGYESDTLQITSFEKPIEVILSKGKTLEEFEVEYRRKTSEVSLIDPINITHVGEKELQKAACCNLSESFETNASIDASFTDAVTGTKQIKMLGLAGKYTQMLQDNVPAIRGLSSIYGLTYVPGPWVGSIQISKGVGSVVNGYESIAGQINVDIKEPFDSEKLHLNMYGNMGGRLEANAIYQQKVGTRFRTNFLLHGKSLQWERDMNNDNFMDNALENDFVVSNLWRFIDDGPWRSEAGITYVQQNHQAGNMGQKIEEGTIPLIPIYSVDIRNYRGEAFWKLGYVGKNNKSVGWQNQFSHQQTDSKFGIRPYNGLQTSYYSNLITQFEIFEGALLKSGASFLYDDYQESFDGLNYQRTEIVPGIFTELTVIKGNWSAIGGLRADLHNLFGLFFTPRLHARYSISDNTSLKIAAGRGQRTANIFADNIGLLASSRQFIISPFGLNFSYGNLRPEIAYNYGINLLHKFRLNYRDGDISVDFYRTDFINQIVMDLDVSPQQVHFTNLNGTSYSNSFQVETNYEIFKRTDLRLAYRFLDVKTEYQAGLREVPLVAKHRGFFNLGYETKLNANNKQWKFDVTAQYIGKQRLPDTFSNPEPYQLAPYAEAFALLSGQITRVFNKKFEVYLGGENLTNYRQSNPILANDQPFSHYFDASMVYGPIFGIMAYGGLRYVID